MMERFESKERIISQEVLEPIKNFQASVRDEVRRQIQEEEQDELVKGAKDAEGDVSYKIDLSAEKFIEGFAEKFSKKYPIKIISEGLGTKIFPKEGKPEYEIIIDPIDGTRGLMYSLREAWILTGVAPCQKNKNTDLSDIHLAVQTEIPRKKQTEASVVWAIKGQGTFEEVWDLRENKILKTINLKSTQASNLENGFAPFTDFFPGAKEEMGRLIDNVFSKILGPVEKGKAVTFNDQFICSGGQIYCLASGRYRFVCDLRPDIEKVLNKKGQSLGLMAHPYDISTLLVAQEAGAIITDTNGKEIKYPLDTKTDCGWIGYANESIKKQVEPVLLEEITNLKKI